MPLRTLCLCGEIVFGQAYLFMTPKKIKKPEKGRKLKKTGDHFYFHFLFTKEDSCLTL
jgi:hypothetical protein